MDNSEGAQRRFKDLARAYHELLEDRQNKQRDDHGEDVSTKSLFEDFHTKMD